MHERIFHFDIIRTVACLMVIIMHAPMPSDRIIGVFTWGITYLTMPCIGLFFALSGALLLPVKKSPLDSVNFVKKRGGRFILPVLLWSLIYLFVNGTFTAGDINMLIKSILSLPFYRQEGVLWFMYVLIGLYIITPVISPWLSCVMFSNLSFGMYLCHILIQRYWLWHVSYILNIQNYILQTFIIIILTILFSYVLSYLLSKLPLGNQIICYKNK